ncbi:MAG: DUF4302 domain-containing protein [Bacteroidales bacterium]|nr:DUF4302 domain-containing protein [Bacteroidales bacterium]
MKKIKIFTGLSLLTFALAFSSCLKDQEDLFEESATKRLTTYLSDVQSTLIGAEYGWKLSYFPDREQSYGGYNYTLRFSTDNVTAQWELSDESSESVTSTYKLCNEDGPCILFDTYNDFLHYFATPSGDSGPGGYEAYDGDFMFIVMGIEDDGKTIRLKGARSGNEMYLYKLEEPASSYLDKLANVEDTMIFRKFNYSKVLPVQHIVLPDTAFDYIDTVTVKINVTDYRVFDFSYSKMEVVENRFEAVEYEAMASGIYDLDGIHFYQPVEIMGDTFEGFNPVCNADSTYSVFGSDVVWNFIRLTPYEELIDGEWYLSYKNLSPSLQADWTIAKNEFNNTFNSLSIDNCIMSANEFDVVFSGYLTRYSMEITKIADNEVALEITGIDPEDVNAEFIEGYCSHYRLLTNPGNGTYKMKALNKRQSEMLLVNQKDPSIYYIISRKQVNAF